MEGAELTSGTLYRIAAFAESPEGGNPAGVWIGEELPDGRVMQEIAADVGYSETAFLAPDGTGEWIVRYYSPAAEVPFCGHATIASGVVLGATHGQGQYRFSTCAGMVPVTAVLREGVAEASFTSVEPTFASASNEVIAEALAALGWQMRESSCDIPPARAYAGAWHLVLAANTLERLTELEYDFDRLRALMLREDLTTLQLIWRESDAVYHARDPFAVGGVVEDPATGAAAAALGGYLRDSGLVAAPASILVRQGETMGRPSRIRVDIPRSGGVVVAGSAVPIAPPETSRWS